MHYMDTSGDVQFQIFLKYIYTVTKRGSFLPESLLHEIDQ